MTPSEVEGKAMKCGFLEAEWRTYERAHSKLSEYRQTTTGRNSLTEGDREKHILRAVEGEMGAELLDTEDVENYFEKPWHKEKKQNTTKVYICLFLKMK